MFFLHVSLFEFACVWVYKVRRVCILVYFVSCRVGIHTFWSGAPLLVHCQGGFFGGHFYPIGYDRRDRDRDDYSRRDRDRYDDRDRDRGRGGGGA